jgi:hypothetical protein
MMMARKALTIMRALKRDCRPIPTLGMLPGCPREVLELEQCTEPERASFGKAPAGGRGHIKRLLVCVILLRNGAYISSPGELSFEEFFLETSTASVSRLTVSALALEVPERALGFILWLLQMQRHPAVRPFVALAALALAPAIGFRDMTDHEIMEICDWVDSEEELSRGALGSGVETGRWLIGLNSYEAIEGRAAEWLHLATRVFDQPRKDYSVHVRARLRQFSDRLGEK